MTAATIEDFEAEGAGALTDGIHLVVDALRLNNVDTIYGLVGIPITDLARTAQASGIRYIGFRHESAAGHAAAAAGFGSGSSSTSAPVTTAIDERGAAMNCVRNRSKRCLSPPTDALAAR